MRRGCALSGAKIRLIPQQHAACARSRRRHHVGHWCAGGEELADDDVLPLPGQAGRGRSTETASVRAGGMSRLVSSAGGAQNVAQHGLRSSVLVTASSRPMPPADRRATGARARYTRDGQHGRMVPQVSGPCPATRHRRAIRTSCRPADASRSEHVCEHKKSADPPATRGRSRRRCVTAGAADGRCHCGRRSGATGASHPGRPGCNSAVQAQVTSSRARAFVPVVSSKVRVHAPSALRERPWWS